MTAVAPQLRRLRDLQYDCAPLKSFRGVHAGDTAILFGKGPSFERWMDRPSALDAVRCCINETVTVVPDPVYHFANDPLDKWAEIIPPTLQATFQPSRLLHDRTIDPVAPAAGDVCLFYDHHAVDPVVDDPLHQADACLTLGIGPSTAASAFQILRLMGFARLIVVGLDGVGGYVRDWPAGPFKEDRKSVV